MNELYDIIEQRDPIKTKLEYITEENYSTVKDILKKEPILGIWYSKKIERDKDNKVQEKKGIYFILINNNEFTDLEIETLNQSEIFIRVDNYIKSATGQKKLKFSSRDSLNKVELIITYDNPSQEKENSKYNIKIGRQEKNKFYINALETKNSTASSVHSEKEQALNKASLAITPDFIAEYSTTIKRKPHTQLEEDNTNEHKNSETQKYIQEALIETSQENSEEELDEELTQDE